MIYWILKGSRKCYHSFMDIVSQINQAVEFVKNKDYKSAEEIYLKVLESNPNNHIVLSFLGYLYITIKDYDKAEKTFDKAYELSQDNTIMSGLGLSKFLLQKFEDTVPIYINLIKQEPKCDYYEKLTLALSTLISTGKQLYLKIAYDYSKDAIKKYPMNKELLLNYSIACIYTGKFQEGEEYCIEVLRMDSKFSRAWNHMGIIQECLYQDEEKAQECYKKAIKYNDTPSYNYDLGISYSKSGKYALATKYLKKALKKMPENNIILWGLTQNYFTQKKFKEGYKYYLQHTKEEKIQGLKNIWDGEEHINSTLFIYSDLAYGDHLMFIRYIPYLKDKFKNIKVFAFPQLIDLFKNSFEGIEFVDYFPEYDYSVVLSKLPYYLKMDFNHIPNSEGYFKVDKEQKINKKLKIGLCWEAGNADIRTTIHRTININEFANLFNSDYEFYSFQVNPSSDDYKKYNLIDLGSTFDNFNDTANALKDMDLLISVDTSVANLAGAMGLKTFMLLPYYSDWRWFDNTEKTEWYDSVRIFKQSEKNSWQSEINKISDELTKLSKRC